MASPDWLRWVSLGTGLPIDGIVDLFSDPHGTWDKFKNGETNTTNKEIADENLEYQRERNEVEDARYEEETQYNRAFAEDERDYNRTFAENERDYQRTWAEDEREYNRALQQQLFEREDTAISRQANELSRLGINPLSQNMNGLGAGSVVSSAPSGSSVAPSNVAPTSSGRGGQALHNDFRMQDSGMLSLLSTVGSLAQSVNSVQTGTLQRDALQLENDRKFLENYAFANKLGVDYDTFGNSKRSLVDKNGKSLFSYFHENGASGSEYYSEKDKIRNIKHKISSGKYDDDSTYLNIAKDIASTDYSQLADRLLTNLSKTLDYGLDNMDNIQEEIGKKYKKYANNGFKGFLNLFNFMSNFF